MRERAREPIFKIPGAVLALLALLTLIHVARAFLPEDVDGAIVATFGFTPARLSYLFDPQTVVDRLNAIAKASPLEAEFASNMLLFAPPNRVWFTPLSYAFLHGDNTHLIFNAVWLAAFGSPVARRFGPLRFLLMGAFGAIFGAMIYFALHPIDFAPLVGASAAISAYMGAAARFVFQPGNFPFRGEEGVRPPPLANFREMLANRQTMAFVAFWFVSNLLIGLGGQSLGLSRAPIAWEAHIGGFFAGIFLAPLFDQRR
jgi:membrane associated rhomboid family serine protease